MEQPNGKQLYARRSRAQMLELISWYDKSQGVTVKAFCIHHQISEGSFYAARKRYRPTSASPKKHSGFIAIASSSLTAASGGLFAEVNGIRLYQAVPADYLKALIV